MSKKAAYLRMAMAVLARGTAGAKKFVADEEVSASTVRRAVAEVKQYDEQIGQGFEQWADETYPPTSRGRKAPAVGSERVYKAQQINSKTHTGAPFLRLPLDTLGIQKGENVTVSFKDDRIIVQKAS